LAFDLHRLCKESGVSAEIESIPLLPGATLDQALFDGEDYELLFTSTRRQNPGFCIGTITKGQPGRIFFRGEQVRPRGYDHFQSNP